MFKINLLLGLASLGLVLSCNSSGDVVGMDEIDLNGPHQIIHKISTTGSTNVLIYNMGGNKFIKLSDTDNNMLQQISYNNNKISNITGFYKDANNGGAVTNFNLNFVYSGTVLTSLQGTEETAGTTSDVATTFTYTNDKLTKTYTTRTQTVAGVAIVNYAQNDLTYTGYNLSQSVFTTGVLNANIPMPGVTVTTTYSGHDSKVSYLYGIPKEYAYYSTYNSSGANYLSPNNAGSVAIEVMGQTQTKNYAYTYGTASMPTVATEGTDIINYTYQPN